MTVCVRVRWEPRLPVPHRNMALLWGLLVLSLSCLQGPYLAVSLGSGLGLDGEEEVGMGEARDLTGRRQGLDLRAFSLLSFSQQFSPASATELWGPQVLGRDGT